jgi:hypothetical protein
MHLFSTLVARHFYIGTEVEDSVREEQFTHVRCASGAATADIPRLQSSVGHLSWDKCPEVTLCLISGVDHNVTAELLLSWNPFCYDLGDTVRTVSYCQRF